MPTIQLQFRRGTATEWSNANPTLAAGELGLETGTNLFKIGNGSTAWNSLSYGGLQGATGPAGGLSNMLSGTVSAPSLAFASDVSAGFYLPASANIGFTTAGVERMRVGSNVRIPTPMRARIVTSNITGTSATVDFTANDGIYYHITNTGFNGLTLTFPGSNNAPGSFNVFRNTTATNLSVTLTYSGGGSGITSPLVINGSNSATIVWNGSTYLLF
jgi:hypothetical protein